MEGNQNEIIEGNDNKLLNESKEIIQKIVNEYTNLSSYIAEKINNSLSNIDEIFNNNVNITKDDRDNKKKDDNNYSFKTIIEGYINLYENEHIKNINSYIYELKLIIDFNLSNINNYSNNGTKEESSTDNTRNEYENEYEDNDDLYEKFYQSDNIDVTNINPSTTILLCSICKKGEEVNYFCNHCNYYLCENCHAQYKKNIEDGDEEETNHNYIRMDDTKKGNEKKKQDFLKSFLSITKKNILKCNYILKNENQEYSNPENYQKFQYPSISNENDFNLQLDFITDINDIYNFIKEKIDIKKTINEEELCLLLLNSFSDIFKGQIQLNQDNIDDDFYSDGHGEEENESEEKDDKNDKNDTNNNNNINNNTSDNFYYIVNIINKQNFMLEDNNYNNTILEKLAKALSTDENNISLLTNNNIIFINNFIKTRQFARLSPKKIRTNYPNLPNLYDFKIIIDGILRLRCQIPVEYLDYKYNFIIPNLSLNNQRGSEIYNPPYGWAGIGLNATKKYDNKIDWLKKDNDKWAIAYYGFGKYLSSEEIGKMLNYIIVKDEFKRELSAKSTELDIRHNGERIGEGIYLSPNVNFAEKCSGTFIFNKKKYKIVLMAKVLIKNIREPKDHSFWILNEGDIRIYKILVKEQK